MRRDWIASEQAAMAVSPVRRLQVFRSSSSAADAAVTAVSSRTDAGINPRSEPAAVTAHRSAGF